jgi:two-component system sensor histidine kinase AgrC
MVSIILSLIMIFYRKSIMDAFVGFGLSYAYITVILYVLVTFNKVIVEALRPSNYNQEKLLILIYCMVFFSYFIFYKYRKNFFNFAFYIKNLKHSIIIVQGIDYTLLFIATLQGEWVTKEMEIVLKAVLITVFATIYIFEAIYFARINEKSKEVEELNVALNAKITELRKIKHDYGSEISTIYGVYQLGNYEKLGKILKGIIEKNQTTSATIEFRTNENPIISSLLNQATLKGVNVIVSDQADYNNLKISDNEFLRLISNIVNNAIDATKDIQNPTIKFTSHNNYEGTIIIIENNGPQIPSDITEKIFNTGFSTKKNDTNDRGFGLSIVKEIVEKCEGDISVQSNNESTKFRMYIPRKLEQHYS